MLNARRHTFLIECGYTECECKDVNVSVLCIVWLVLSAYI